MKTLIVLAKGDPSAVKQAAERAIILLKPPLPPRPRWVSKSDTSASSAPCKYRELCQRFKATMDLIDAFFAPRFDMCYCNSCHIGRGDELYYSRGQPPKDYGLPIGWCRFAIRLSGRAAALDVFNKWHTAFHGTHLCTVKPILECGDLLMPGDIEMEGRKLGERPGHYTEENKPDGFDTKQIFLSPSIRYSGCDVYAFPSKFEDDVTKKTYSARVAFQVWIKPNSYSVGPETIGAKSEIDPKFSNQELEWFTKRRGCVMVSGLLIKLE
ncbi:neuralized-like protein 4 isoform X2 [Ptychodera flava]|uniref:neuralized-like protein 4 isoform X2 n=1 Tax=Ptychodera flava TaxID=63121 RepID=UPI00396A6DCE